MASSWQDKGHIMIKHNSHSNPKRAALTHTVSVQYPLIQYLFFGFSLPVSISLLL